MIKNVKPQAYSSSTGQLEELLIPAASINFPDNSTLDEKAENVNNDIITLQQKVEGLEGTVNKSLEIPVQLGTLVYNGNVQTPVFSLNSSRVTVTGDTEGRDAGSYTALFTLLNGAWTGNSLAKQQRVVWTIQKKKLPKPFISSVFFEDGNLHEVQLGNYNSSLCRLSGTVQERHTGSYTVIVTLNSSNVTWDDGTTEPVSLVWHIMRATAGYDGINTGEQSVISAKITTLQTEIATLRQNVIANRETIDSFVNNNEEQQVWQPSVESTKRRLKLLECFLFDDDITTRTQITGQVQQLETVIWQISRNDLAAEVEIVIKVLDKLIAATSNHAELDTLNSLKSRANELFTVKEAATLLQQFKQELLSKKEQILVLLISDHLAEAQDIYDTSKSDFSTLLGTIDYSRVKEMVQDINQIFDSIKTQLVKKEINNTLDTISVTLDSVEQRILTEEDMAQDLADITAVLNNNILTAENYGLMFEKDRAITLTVRVQKLETLNTTSLDLQDVMATLNNLKINMLVYTTTRISADITIARQKLNRVTGLNLTSLEAKITAATQELDIVQQMFETKQANTELVTVRERLAEIAAAIEGQQYDDNDLLVWKDIVEKDSKTINAMDQTLAEFAATLEQLEKTKGLLIIADLQDDLDRLSQRLNAVATSIDEGTANYYTIKNQIVIIQEDIRNLTVISEDTPVIVKNKILELQDRAAFLSQLNDDKKLYLELNPELIKIRQKIYDEDLDILWNSLSTVKARLNDESTTEEYQSLVQEANDLETLLNSYRRNSSFEIFLQHLDDALKVIVTTDIFTPTSTGYDTARDDLRKLEQNSVIVNEDDDLDFSLWYSLTDEEKAYRLENNLRKIRRKAVTIAV